MNKYRDKSDFEINKAVAVNINGTDAVLEKFGGIYISDGDRGAMVSFSPCNNPADAMPIIIENGISIIKSSGGWICCHGAAGVIEHENLYRAAMICFLMMKDADNEKWPPLRNMQ
ncbi:phage protein NinX family protein [Morganella morganii]|uniref:phage protein NinX family protein n=1 Tax=Morganella morganii TaxID=582 RepID=UPI000C7C5F3A|nr:phage protein NinX family protein [Morganella morganii]MDI9764577.1 DUF2591 family protein [Morganella morganii]PLA34760.1 recombinase [Morganella morganii]